MSIAIPRLVPTEAWGDPGSQSRKEIQAVFNVFRRGNSVRERIEQINSFLSPTEALRKAPGGKINTLLRMMQVIEALQAAINDYSESSAGFVFEGLMAAITGGTQEAGRVGGTLPIEDFTTGGGENVSLKLLSPGTGIHGSFTNLIDYLFLRGDAGLPEIKYLVAYKAQDEGTVTKLAIYDFLITRDNIVDVMTVTKNGPNTFGNQAAAAKDHIQSWQDSPEWRLKMAEILGLTPGYDKKKGMFAKSLDDIGNRTDVQIEPGKDLATKKAKQYDTRTAGGALITLKQQTRTAGAAHARGEGPDFETWYAQNIDSDLLQMVGKTAKTGPKTRSYIKFFKDEFEKGSSLAESFFGEFDAREKFLINEGKASAGDGGAQWTISGTQLEKADDILRTSYYGELDLSQKNIDELSKIYIEKLGEDVRFILEATKQFTENIGEYFTSEDRSKAMSASDTAQERGREIVTKLAEQTEED